MPSSSDPLLAMEEGLDSSSSQSSSRRRGGEYDLEIILGQAASLNEVIRKVRSRSRYWLVKNETQLYEDSDALSHINDVFMRYQARFDEASQWKQLEILFSLEHAMAAQTYQASRLMNMFGTNVEDLLGKSPGDREVTKFQDSFVALRDKKFPREGKSWTVLQWAEMQRYEKLELPDREAMQEQEHDFCIWLSKELKEIRTENGENTLYGWFVHALERSAKTGNFIFMSIDNLLQFVEISRGKNTVRNSPVGWVAEQLLKYQSIDDSSFMSADWSWKFQKIRVETFPKFVSDLSELCGVIEAQKNTVHDAKSKVITIFVTIVITGGQLFMKLLSQEFEESQGLK